MVCGKEKHVDRHIQAFELGDALLPEERCEIEELEVSRRAKRCQIQLVFHRNPTLVDTALDILRAVKDRLLRRVQSPAPEELIRLTVVLAMGGGIFWIGS